MWNYSISTIQQIPPRLPLYIVSLYTTLRFPLQYCQDQGFVVPRPESSAEVKVRMMVPTCWKVRKEEVSQSSRSWMSLYKQKGYTQILWMTLFSPRKLTIISEGGSILLMYNHYNHKWCIVCCKLQAFTCCWWPTPYRAWSGDQANSHGRWVASP